MSLHTLKSIFFTPLSPAVSASCSISSSSGSSPGLRFVLVASFNDLPVSQSLLPDEEASLDEEVEEPDPLDNDEESNTLNRTLIENNSEQPPNFNGFAPISQNRLDRVNEVRRVLNTHHLDEEYDIEEDGYNENTEIPTPVDHVNIGGQDVHQLEN